MNSVTLPISGLDPADFTLIFTPSATETLTAETLDAPPCPNTLTESKQEYLSSIRQSIDGSPFLRVQPPRYRLWETPTGIPPLRQRARNDGLTTDTRQEKRQLAASPMLVPTQWWVGQPGGGSTT